MMNIIIVTFEVETTIDTFEVDRHYVKAGDLSTGELLAGVPTELDASEVGLLAEGEEVVEVSLKDFSIVRNVPLL